MELADVDTEIQEEPRGKVSVQAAWSRSCRAEVMVYDTPEKACSDDKGADEHSACYTCKDTGYWLEVDSDVCEGNTSE